MIKCTHKPIKNFHNVQTRNELRSHSKSSRRALLTKYKSSDLPCEAWMKRGGEREGEGKEGRKGRRERKPSWDGYYVSMPRLMLSKR